MNNPAESASERRAKIVAAAGEGGASYVDRMRSWARTPEDIAVVDALEAEIIEHGIHFGLTDNRKP